MDPSALPPAADSALFCDRTADIVSGGLRKKDVRIAAEHTETEESPIQSLLNACASLSTEVRASNELLLQFSNLIPSQTEITRAEIAIMSKSSQYKSKIEELEKLIGMTFPGNTNRTHEALHIKMVLEIIKNSVEELQATVCRMRTVPRLYKAAGLKSDSTSGYVMSLKKARSLGGTALETEGTMGPDDTMFGSRPADTVTSGAWGDVEGVAQTQTLLGKKLRTTTEMGMVEQSALEIRAMNEALATEVSLQAERIDAIYEYACTACDDIDQGNKSLVRATNGISLCTKITIIYLVTCTLLILLPALRYR